MKKALALFASLAIIGFVSSNEIQATTNSNSISTSSEISSSANTRTITVYMIKQLSSHSWSKTTKKGIYDSDDNTIKVDGDTYSIRTNSYSGGGRENYDYQAGGIYFFNL